MARVVPLVLALMLQFGITDPTWATVTDWHVDHTPILLGDVSTWTATGTSYPPVASYKWEVQGVGKTGTLGPWNDLLVNAATTSRYMIRAGTLNVRLTVKYQKGMGQTQADPDSIITHFINVQAPDSDPVVSGLGVPTLLDATGTTRVTVVFEMRKGAAHINPHFDGYAQEDILSWVGYNPITDEWEDIEYEPGWDPEEGETSTVFYRANFSIYDKKYAWCGPTWYAMFANDFTWMKVTQVNRLVTGNWIDEEVIIEFDPHDFEMKKSGANTWILAE